MAVLSRVDLVNKVKQAIKDSGWKIESETDANQFPVRFEVAQDDQRQIIRFYIWNLTHGGAPRPENEYRIQVKVDRFEEESDSKTLILGYQDELQVFSGFDLAKHKGKPGWSASMQIKLEYLKQAKEKGAVAYSKENGEIAIAFSPNFFMRYVDNIYELHLTGDVSKNIFKDQREDDDIIVDDTENEDIPFRYSVNSYGADYPVDSIVKRIKDNVIFVPPFQRNFVWNNIEASRFIESLIIGLPVPGVFLSREEETNRLLIVDGQQRLFSLYSFYENNFKGKSFKLKGVTSDLEGKTYNDLSISDRTRLNDSIIHATIIKQEDPEGNENSIYLIFERLNSSGRPLTAQEVRACVYYGSFNEYLTNVVLNAEWRSIFGKMNERLKEQEMLLRFFALYFNLESYKKPLKVFLNNFMFKNRDLQLYSSEVLDRIILPAITLMNNQFGKQSFRISRTLNVAIFDSIMVGVAKRLEKGPIDNLNEFQSAYLALLEDTDYIYNTREATSDEAAVNKRMSIAINQFEHIK